MVRTGDCYGTDRGLLSGFTADDCCNSTSGRAEDTSQHAGTCLPAPWHVLPKHSSMPCSVPVSTYEHVPIVPRNESSQSEVV